MPKELFVRSEGQDAQLAALADQPRSAARALLANTISGLKHTLVIVELELRKMKHEPTALIARTIQPLLWLVVFSQVFSKLRILPSGGESYTAFMAPGIVAQAALFGAMFYGTAIIRDRDLGVVYKLMVSPMPRVSFALGKALAASVRCIPPAAIIYFASMLLGVEVNWNPLAILGVFVVVVLGAALFTSLAVSLACVVKTHERFMGLSQFLTMPLFLASNAIYPLALMPEWLQLIARFNPVTYQVDALRALMVVGAVSVYGIGFDIAVLLVCTTILVMIASRLSPRLVS